MVFYQPYKVQSDLESQKSSKNPDTILIYHTAIIYFVIESRNNILVMH